MPAWGQIIVPISPLTYTTDLTKYALGEITYYLPLFNFLMLLIFTAIFLFIGFKLHAKTMSKRL